MGSMVDEETENWMQTSGDTSKKGYFANYRSTTNHHQLSDGIPVTPSHNSSNHHHPSSSSNYSSKNIIGEDGDSDRSKNIPSSSSCGSQQCHDPLPNCRGQYCFSTSNVVWSSGLYCNIQEDLNLTGWKFFDSCKRIWENAGEGKCSSSTRRGENGRVKTKVVSYSLQSDADCGSGTVISRTLKSSRDMATSPANLGILPSAHPPYEDQLSDLSSLSLESISSSSFHSSTDSDFDGDAYSKWT